MKIIFDGAPASKSGRFVEVEDDDGNSITVGKWEDRGDGTLALVLSRESSPLALDEIANRCLHGWVICVLCDFVPSSWQVQS